MTTGRRFPQFNVRWLLAVTAICALLASHVATRYKQMRLARHVQNAQSISSFVLTALHVNDNGPVQSKVKALGLKRPAYLLPSGQFTDGSRADAYEMHLLSKVQLTDNGADVYVRHIAGEAVTYYRIIREMASCKGCHEATRPRPGGPMVVMKMAMNNTSP